MPILGGRPTGKANLSSGRRTRYVLIRKVNDGVALSGFPKEVLSDIGWDWMSRHDTEGSERLKSSQISASVMTEWHLGYRPDMDPEIVDVPKTRKIVYQGRTYDIIAASLFGERLGIQLLTVAKSG